MEYLTEAIKAGWKVTEAVEVTRRYGTYAEQTPALKLELNA